MSPVRLNVPTEEELSYRARVLQDIVARDSKEPDPAPMVKLTTVHKMVYREKKRVITELGDPVCPMAQAAVEGYRYHVAVLATAIVTIKR